MLDGGAPAGAVGIPVDNEKRPGVASRSDPSMLVASWIARMDVYSSSVGSAATSPTATIPHPLRDGSAHYLRTHRRLLTRITQNELQARYAGSHLGSLWVFLAPMLLLVVYAVTYVAILKVRLAGLGSKEYVVFIFSGLVPYLMTAEALATGVTSVLANKAVLNNTVFPIDLAPVKAVLTSQATMLVGLCVTVIGSAGVGTLRWTIVLLPLIWFCHVIGLIGIVWFISLLNVLFRDIQNLLTPVLMMMLIISPIAYTPSIVPDSLRPLILLNPFSYFVVAYQQVITLGIVPSVAHIAAIVVLALVPFVAGSWFFAKAKRVIVDYV